MKRCQRVKISTKDGKIERQKAQATNDKDFRPWAVLQVHEPLNFSSKFFLSQVRNLHSEQTAA